MKKVGKKELYDLILEEVNGLDERNKRIQKKIDKRDPAAALKKKLQGPLNRAKKLIALGLKDDESKKEVQAIMSNFLGQNLQEAESDGKTPVARNLLDILEPIAKDSKKRRVAISELKPIVDKITTGSGKEQDDSDFDASKISGDLKSPKSPFDPDDDTSDTEETSGSTSDDDSSSTGVVTEAYQVLSEASSFKDFMEKYELLISKLDNQEIKKELTRKMNIINEIMTDNINIPTVTPEQKVNSIKKALNIIDFSIFKINDEQSNKLKEDFKQHCYQKANIKEDEEGGISELTIDDKFQAALKKYDAKRAEKRKNIEPGPNQLDFDQKTKTVRNAFVKAFRKKAKTWEPNEESQELINSADDEFAVDNEESDQEYYDLLDRLVELFKNKEDSDLDTHLHPNDPRQNSSPRAETGPVKDENRETALLLRNEYGTVVSEEKIIKILDELKDKEYEPDFFDIKDYFDENGVESIEKQDGEKPYFFVNEESLLKKFKEFIDAKRNNNLEEAKQDIKSSLKIFIDLFEDVDELKFELSKIFKSYEVETLIWYLSDKKRFATFMNKYFKDDELYQKAIKSKSSIFKRFFHDIKNLRFDKEGEIFDLRKKTLDDLETFDFTSRDKRHKELMDKIKKKIDKDNKAKKKGKKLSSQPSGSYNDPDSLNTAPSNRMQEILKPVIINIIQEMLEK